MRRLSRTTVANLSEDHGHPFASKQRLSIVGEDGASRTPPQSRPIRDPSRCESLGSSSDPYTARTTPPVTHGIGRNRPPSARIENHESGGEYRVSPIPFRALQMRGPASRIPSQGLRTPSRLMNTDSRFVNILSRFATTFSHTATDSCMQVRMSRA